MDYTNEVNAFTVFCKEWALATAGDINDYNGCTIGWGGLGNVWSMQKHTCTVYVNPARYTCSYLLNNDYFTVSVFPEEQRKALQILGSKSGRDCDKFAESGLTPVQLEHGVAFKEARITFVCRKIYTHQFDKEHMSEDMAARVTRDPETHYMFIGEIVEALGPDEL